MPFGDPWFQYARLARGLPSFLATPVHPAQARSDVRRRLENRNEGFLELMRVVVFENRSSPYRKRFAAAGCDFGDLQQSVARQGLEPTLERLCDAGVRVSLDELKGLSADFDNPCSETSALLGTTSGTRSRASRVAYDWTFIAEEAANECLLYDIHGLGEAPVALWYPLRRGIAGVHNLLMDLKRGCPPERWFTQTRGAGVREVAMCAAIRWFAGRRSMRVRWPEAAALDDADRVASWLVGARDRSSRAVLRTFTSSAVRVARAAQTRGVSLDGCVIFCGGEPLTEDRHRVIAESGARAVPRYVSSESGLIAAACDRADRFDAMHVYTDRIAILSSQRSLLLTTLLPSSGKILLNAEIGDLGTLAERACDCLFGELGMNLQVSGVHSDQRWTIEGVAVPLTDLDLVAGAVLRQFGAQPDDFQFRERASKGGIAGLDLVVDPSLELPGEGRVLSELWAEFRRRLPEQRVAADLWEHGGTIRLCREAPRPSQAHKLPRVAR